MFRHVLSPFNCSSALKTHHPFYATLAVPIDSSRSRLVDDLPSVEKKSRKRRDKEDPSMFFYFFQGDMARNNHSPFLVCNSQT